MNMIANKKITYLHLVKHMSRNSLVGSMTM